VTRISKAAIKVFLNAEDAAWEPRHADRMGKVNPSLWKDTKKPDDITKRALPLISKKHSRTSPKTACGRFGAETKHSL
jgi:hypothetical protein